MREELLRVLRTRTDLPAADGRGVRSASIRASRDGCCWTADGCDDPHVERLMRGVRVYGGACASPHRRRFPAVERGFAEPDLSELPRPVPAMTIVEMLPDPAQGKKTAGMPVPRGTPLVSKSDCGRDAGALSDFVRCDSVAAAGVRGGVAAAGAAATAGADVERGPAGGWPRRGCG